MKYYVVVFCLFSFLSFSQTQVGSDINGDAAGDYFGISVSTSENGSIVAIGAIHNDDNGSNSGYVRVFENISGDWTQIGDDINGEAEGDSSGYSISLSSDGNILAIGAPFNDGNGSNSGHVRVFKNINGSWTQIGEDINGEAISDTSGFKVSLSSDGNIVAIGAPGNDDNGVDSGHVRIYKNINNIWIQFGNDINGINIEDNLFNCSLSSDGNIVAIGVNKNDTQGLDTGSVYIYEIVNNVWTQIGQDIYGVGLWDWSGYSISLSSDGNVIAIGAPYNNSNSVDSGHVRIYENVNNTWTQIGNDINGEAAGDQLGYGVSLSSDGNTIAINAPYNDGYVRIYKNINNTWIQFGNNINGSGFSISLSSDGNVVAIGSPYSGNENSGYVRIYDLTGIEQLSINDLVFKDLNIYPNPAKEVINVNVKSYQTLQELKLYNFKGQLIKSSTKPYLDVDNESSGLYFLQVITNEDKTIKKIIIE